MNSGENRHQTIPLGVVLRRAPGVTRWAKWSWRAVAVLPGAGPADWRELRRDGDVVEYHAATAPLTLHRAETEAYMVGLADKTPSVYVIMRQTGDEENPFEVVVVTASPYDAQDYTDNGEDIVEKVAMPAGLIAWVQEFTLAHHEEEVFVKRRRDRKDVDAKDDGIGDARIRQTADVYRAPARKEPVQ